MPDGPVLSAIPGLHDPSWGYVVMGIALIALFIIVCVRAKRGDRG
jgi:hypothetical protein